MAHFSKHTKGNSGGWFATTEYTTSTLLARVTNRVLETYMNGLEDSQEGSVDWDRHWILVGRVAVSTDTQGNHYVHVFKSTMDGLMFLDEVIAPPYQAWLAQDDGDIIGEYLTHLQSRSLQGGAA
jgi:hypothetical protein